MSHAALLEHSYCMLEELQKVIALRMEEGRTTSAYQNNHNTPPTLLEHRLNMHTYTGQSTRHRSWGPLSYTSMTTMSRVQFVMLQHEKLL